MESSSEGLPLLVEPLQRRALNPTEAERARRLACSFVPAAQMQGPVVPVAWAVAELLGVAGGPRGFPRNVVEAAIRLLSDPYAIDLYNPPAPLALLVGSVLQYALAVDCRSALGVLSLRPALITLLGSAWACGDYDAGPALAAVACADQAGSLCQHVTAACLQATMYDASAPAVIKAVLFASQPQQQDDRCGRRSPSPPSSVRAQDRSGCLTLRAAAAVAAVSLASAIPPPPSHAALSPQVRPPAYEAMPTRPTPPRSPRGAHQTVATPGSPRPQGFAEDSQPSLAATSQRPSPPPRPANMAETHVASGSSSSAAGKKLWASETYTAGMGTGKSWATETYAGSSGSKSWLKARSSSISALPSSRFAFNSRAAEEREAAGAIAADALALVLRMSSPDCVRASLQETAAALLAHLRGCARVQAWQRAAMLAASASALIDCASQGGVAQLETPAGGLTPVGELAPALFGLVGTFAGYTTVARSMIVVPYRACMRSELVARACATLAPSVALAVDKIIVGRGRRLSGSAQALVVQLGVIDRLGPFDGAIRKAFEELLNDRARAHDCEGASSACQALVWLLGARGTFIRMGPVDSAVAETQISIATTGGKRKAKKRKHKNVRLLPEDPSAAEPAAVLSDCTVDTVCRMIATRPARPSDDPVWVVAANHVVAHGYAEQAARVFSAAASAWTELSAMAREAGPSRDGPYSELAKAVAAAQKERAKGDAAAKAAAHEMRGYVEGAKKQRKECFRRTSLWRSEVVCNDPAPKRAVSERHSRGLMWRQSSGVL
eukprot:m51a1_g9557 hypothetical protein (783) ;mRNA; r:891110-893997